MNLSYRGISYQTASHFIEPTEIAQVNHCLGRSYRLLQGKVAQRQNLIALNYHGKDYSA